MVIPKQIFFFLFVLFSAIQTSAVLPFTEGSSQDPIDESQIFEWWDDGLISGEEATELLDKIQEENFDEACHLAEALALKACKTRKPPAQKEIPSKKETLSATGYFVYKARVDSLGNMDKASLDLQVKFYRLVLHLGSRNLLTYRNDGAEAYLGEISTQEFHSPFATDTLWGTVLRYPLRNFRIQAAMDSAYNLQGDLSYQRRGFSGNVFAWHHRETNSAGLHLKIPEGEIAGWWQLGQEVPLLKFQMRQNASKKDSLQVSWQTTAIFHGEEIPEQAHLSSTLLKNKFTGTQAIHFAAPSYRGSPEASVNARVFIPVENDSLKARLKFSGEYGPVFLRATAETTCQETTLGCPKNDFKFKLMSSGFSDFTYGASIRSNFARKEGFSPPRWETALSYQPDSHFFARITASFPKGNPQEQIQIRSESVLETKYFHSNFVVTFRNTRTQKFHPVHGLFQLKWLF